MAELLDHDHGARYSVLCRKMLSAANSDRDRSTLRAPMQVLDAKDRRALVLSRLEPPRVVIVRFPASADAASMGRGGACRP